VKSYSGCQSLGGGFTSTQPPEWWRRVFDAADRALELEAAERMAFLEQCSASDPVLARELRALLSNAEAASPLDQPASAFAAPIIEELESIPNPVAPGSRFGAYRIVGEIGRGGMGAVYLAERSDDQYQKRVALKVLPSWSAGDDRPIQRFLEERQILAALEHPGIAGLVDGGVTPEGLPWFAMELVEGVKIDRYCDEHFLTVEDRLELFCQVCAAVQYAHRNLVVHRDLKPANILVTADGRIRLLDFGIAKLIGGDIAATDLTASGERLLTPLYASPEQIRGEPTSTASDVYALGVLLNMLLTSRYPYDLVSSKQKDVALAVLEQAPVPPSVSVLRAGAPESNTPLSTPEQIATLRSTSVPKLSRRLRGDLDSIVLKAVEKEPSRRYTTAEQLESDVRRHLAGLPVLARVGSRSYYARKFIRRHQAAVAVAAAVAVLILSFTVVATVQRSRIRAQAARIAIERDRAKEVSRYLINLFQTATPGRPDRGVTSRDILDSATAHIDQQRLANPERAQLLYEMAGTYHRLNLHDKARSLVERSLALRRGLQPKGDVDVAESLNLLGSVLLAQGQLAPAERAYTEALALRRQALGPGDGAVARTLVGLASVLRAEHRLSDAESLAREAMATDRARRGDTRADLAQSTSALARVLLDKGDHRGAAVLFRRALVLLRATHPEEHVDVASGVFDLAAALKSAGDPAADSLFRYGLGLYHRLLSVAALSGTTDITVPVAARTHEDVTVPVQRAFAEPSVPRTVASGAAAPDHSLIAFSSDRDGPDPIGDMGNQEIYVMNADGSDQRRLTFNDGVDTNAAWSPDGKTIAFTSVRAGGLEIYVMNADGSGARRLTNQTASGLGAIDPKWSPDGRRIAFRTRSRPDIYTVNVDGTGVTNLTHHPASDVSPAWSPDGGRIAFVSERDGNPEIYLMDPNGENVIRLTHTDAREGLPAWSPDGKKIAFNSNRDGDGEIYVMNSDGSNTVRLTSNPGQDGYPSWSPDGRRIAFHRRVLGHLQIYTMNADGSNQMRLTELSPKVFNGYPSWGPPQR
jgi:eukaryotic-like serine/threonine-protein kinase